MNIIAQIDTLFQKACLLAGLFCVLGISPFAQSPDTTNLLSVAEMQADLAELHRLILETHVNPYTYTSQDEFEAAFKRANERLQQPMSRMEFAAVVGSVLQVIQDSHTSLNLSDLSEAYKAKNGRSLRLKVMKLPSGVYIKKSRYEQLPPGTRLLSINGHPADSLYNASKQYAMVEGTAHEGLNRITDAIFPLAVGWMIPLQELNTFWVALPGRGDSTALEIRAYTPSEIKQLQRKEQGAKNTYQLHLYPDSNLAVLKIGSFSALSAGKYNRFLKRSFKKIRKSHVQNVAIDLRDNTGGNSDRMEMLFAYLTPNPPAIPANVIAKQSPTSIRHIQRQYKGLKRFVIDHLFKHNEDAVNYRKMASLENGMVDTLYYTEGPTPHKRRLFNGNLFLLINGRSGSASVNFTSVFKQMNLGTVIGEPCLGPQTGTWGNAASAELPNSGIKLYLSTIRYNTDNLFQVDPVPIQPDVYITYTPEDLEKARDPALEYLFKITRPKQ